MEGRPGLHSLSSRDARGQGIAFTGLSQEWQEEEVIRWLLEVSLAPKEQKRGFHQGLQYPKR